MSSFLARSGEASPTIGNNRRNVKQLPGTRATPPVHAVVPSRTARAVSAVGKDRTEVGRHEFVTDHYRRHIDAQELLASVLERGFLLRFFHESDGLAAYQDENPVVVRMALLRP